MMLDNSGNVAFLEPFFGDIFLNLISLTSIFARIIIQTD